jgi:methionine-rich copper-binding protein CopC
VRRATVIVCWMLVVDLWLPASVGAHAYLVRSSPAARAVVVRPPARAQLWFNERLEPAYSQVSVWNASGQRVDAGDGAVAPDEPVQLSVGLPLLPPGIYTVKYRVLSVDGHLVEAQLTFTVRGTP